MAARNVQHGSLSRVDSCPGRQRDGTMRLRNPLKSQGHAVTALRTSGKRRMLAKDLDIVFRE